MKEITRFLVVALLIVSTWAFGATAYISKAGNDTSAALNNPANPYLTITAAVTALKANGAGPHTMSFQDSTDVTYLDDGMEGELYSWNPVTGLTIEKYQGVGGRVTIQNLGGDSALNTGDPKGHSFVSLLDVEINGPFTLESNGWGVVWIKKGRTVTFSNGVILKQSGTGKRCIGFDAGLDTHPVTFNWTGPGSCELYAGGSNKCCIQMVNHDAATSYTIDGIDFKCHTDNSGGGAIQCGGAGTINIQNCTFDKGPYAFKHCIKTNDMFPSGYHWVGTGHIVDCDLGPSTRDCFKSWKSAGTWTIERCQIYSADRGVYAEAWDDITGRLSITVKECDIWGHTASGVHVYKSDGDPRATTVYADINLINCLIYNNGAEAVYVGDLDGAININHCTMIASDQNGNPAGNVIYSDNLLGAARTVNVTNCVLDGNADYSKSAGATDPTFTNLHHNTLACSTTNLTPGGTDTTADPYYAGGSSQGDLSFLAGGGSKVVGLHLAGGSSAQIDTGTVDNDGSPDDIEDDADTSIDCDADARGLAPDMGADELTGAVDTPTPTATPTETPIACTPGDLDDDGDVDLFDVLRAVDIVLDVGAPPSPIEQCAGDIDTDGDIDLFDILAIVDIVLGS